MRKTKSGNQNRFSKFLEIPAEIVSSNPKITILGFDKMLIENYKGILEYEEFFIRISTHIGIININGFELKIDEITQDDCVVNGRIEGIDFEKTIDYEEE